MSFLPKEECYAYGVMYGHLVKNMPKWNNAGRYGRFLLMPGQMVAMASAEVMAKGIRYDVEAVQDAAARIDPEHANWETNPSGESQCALGYYHGLAGLKIGQKKGNRTGIYKLCVSEASEYADRDAFVSDLALSTEWGDHDDDDIPAERIAWLGQIYDATHRDLRSVLSVTGLNQKELANRYDIPLRSIENWCRGVSSPPPYLLMLIQESLGLVSLQPPEGESK